MNTKEAIEWTEEQLNLLCQNYQIETNEQLAQRLGISTRTLRRKAKRLGLVKREPVTKTKQIEDLVREMYPNHSLKEIAAQANISWRTAQDGQSDGTYPYSRGREPDALQNTHIPHKVRTQKDHLWVRAAYQYETGM